MTPTPVNAIQYLAPGSKIECVEGTLVKLFTDRKEGVANVNGEAKPWSFQNGTFRGTDGMEIKIKFDSFDLLGQEIVGKPVRFITSSDPKAKSISVDEYQGKKSIQIRPSATWEWLSGQAAPQHQQAPQPQQQYGPPPGAYAPPPQNQGPPRQAPPPSYQQHQQQAPRPAPPAQSGPMPILGATVGMAVKLAGDFMIKDYWEQTSGPGTPDFAKKLYQIASDIIRVSELLQQGRLAKTATERLRGPAPAPAPAPPTQQHVEPDYEHMPPPNAAERAAAANRANGYPEDYNPEHHGDGPQYGGSRPALMEDSEIPF